MDFQIIPIIDIQRAAEFAAEKGLGWIINPHPGGSSAHDIWAAAYHRHVAQLDLAAA